MAPTAEALALPAFTTTYNTRNLPQRLSGDLLAAAAAGVVVAPIITMIDRAIIENASSRSTLTTSLRTSLRTLLTRPHRFLTSKPFLLIFALYTGTYLTANLVDTASVTLSPNDTTPFNPAKTTSGTSKFVATSAANLSLCLYKDSQFTRMFGAAPTHPAAKAAAAAGVPLATYALFATRDCLTIFASFNLPPLLSQHPFLQNRSFPPLTLAQFLAPASVQLFSTPLHLLGLDLYNRPGVGAGERVRRVARDWAKSCAARVCRILPAFGVGGVVNLGVRGRLLGGL